MNIVVEWEESHYSGGEIKTFKKSGVIIDTGYNAEKQSFRLLVKPFEKDEFLTLPASGVKIIEKTTKDSLTYGKILDIDE